MSRQYLKTLYGFQLLNADSDRNVVHFEGKSESKLGKWIAAKDLQVGDLLLQSDNSQIRVNSINVETLSKPETTYNFEVEDYHTYFVGKQKIYVHNLCKQQLVAGSENGWNAKVSVGGEANHATPHAHINWKGQKLASVDVNGKILAKSSSMTNHTFSKLMTFVRDNMDDIAKGIIKWY